MSISNRIKERRKSLGMTQEQLAKKIGVSQNAIHKLEDGTTKKPRNILELSRVLGCQPDWLQYGNGSPQVLAHVDPGPEIVGLYPLITWQQAAAWTNIRDLDSSELEFYPCPAPASNEGFILKIQGVSMEPKFKDGDLIFVDSQTQWRHGSYVVVKLNADEDVTFRQLLIEGKQKYLRAINTNWQEKIIAIGHGDKIIGTVVFSGQIL